MNPFYYLLFELFKLILINDVNYAFSINIQPSIFSHQSRSTVKITDKNKKQNFLNTTIKNLKRNLYHSESPPGPTMVYDSMNVIIIYCKNITKKIFFLMVFFF